MLKLTDLLAVLDRWDVWKRVSATPERVDELEKRVLVLEEKLGDTWPADVCPHCGKRAMRQTFSRPETKDTVLQEWTCGECNYDEKRLVKPRDS